MWKNEHLQTRVVILEAALTWIRHESTRDQQDAKRALERIAAIATQVIEDDTDPPLSGQRTRQTRAATASASSLTT